MRRFLPMFIYLCVVFGLFVLNESLVLSERNLSFAPQGFALISAVVMAKVMLIADSLKLGRRFDHLPLIWPVAYKGGLLALVFVLFHAIERIALGRQILGEGKLWRHMFHARPAASSHQAEETYRNSTPRYLVDRRDLDVGIREAPA